MSTNSQSESGSEDENYENPVFKIGDQHQRNEVSEPAIISRPRGISPESNGSNSLFGSVNGLKLSLLSCQMAGGSPSPTRSGGYTERAERKNEFIVDSFRQNSGK